MFDKFKDRSVNLTCNKNGSTFFNQTGNFNIECEIVLIKGVKINKERIYISVTGDSTSIPKKPILVSPGSSRSSGLILTSLNPVLS